MGTKYKVDLTLSETEELLSLISQERISAKKALKARIILKADCSEVGEGWSDQEIAEALEISAKTVERLRKQFVEEGLESALTRKPYDSSRIRRKFDGEAEARLVALCCSEPPEGSARWSVRLLADKVVELQIVESVGRECVRETLKKMKLSLG